MRIVKKPVYPTAPREASAATFPVALPSAWHIATTAHTPTLGDRSYDPAASRRSCDPDEWKASNPKGLCEWFNEKNLPFRYFGLVERKMHTFEQYRDVYERVGDVPDDMDRSSLQRAIQVAKRSRDVFFDRAHKTSAAPSSCAIMVLVTSFAEGLPASAGIDTILGAFTDGCLAMRKPDGSAQIRIPNPVFDEDLADGWSQGKKDAFILWIENLKESMETDFSDARRRNAAYDAIMGKGASARREKDGTFTPAPKAARIERPVKPWRPRRGN